MSHECRTFSQFPRGGDWFDQDDFEMEAMRTADAAESVYMKQKRGAEWNYDDARFVAWVEGE